MAMPKNFGFAREKNQSIIIREINENTIHPDHADEDGHFHWFFGYRSQMSAENNSVLVPDEHTRQKFQFVADMGLLPDNQILSNKLINIYGKRIFDLIHDKSRTVDQEASWRKRVGIALGVTHVDFSSNKRADMHVCWISLQKIRAVQEIDTLFNTTASDFSENYQRIVLNVKKKISDFATIVIQLCDDKKNNEKYLSDIYFSELKELGMIKRQVETLEEQLTLVNVESQYQRNKTLETWQRSLFRQINDQFHVHQGKIGLSGQSMPAPFENISNSNIHTEADYAIQEYIYQQWQPVTKSQLWLIDEDDKSDVLSSAVYANNPKKQKELLLGACLGEAISATNNCFDCVDQVGMSTIKNARNHYQKTKKNIQTLARDVRKNKKNHLFHSVKEFLVPEKIDPETELELTSREFARYFRSLQLQFGFKEKLDNDLSNALNELNAINDAPKEFKQPEEKKSEETHLFKYAPLQNPVLFFKEDDLLSAALNFFYEFSLFMDRDLMAKRPICSMFFFSLPFIQLALPVFAGSTVFLEKLTSAIFVIEANLAKYTGLNAFLNTVGHVQITAGNLQQAINAVREAGEWFTCAEGTFEKGFVGSLVAKILFNIAELLLKNPCLQPDAALLSEYITELFPTVSGSLQGKTAVETCRSIASGFLKISVELLAAAYGVGGLEHASHIVGETLGKVTFVPWGKIAHPHFNVSLVQTLGVSKAASLILLKVYGILGQVESGQLIDIDGHQLRKNSKSFSILQFFVRVHQSSDEYKNKIMKSVSYMAVREHFQELLAHNCSLWEIYKDEDGTFKTLKNLGVKKILPKRRHQYSMALLKTIPAVIKMGVGLIPAIFVTLPTLIMSAVTGKAPKDLLSKNLKPFYQYGLESLNLWVKAAKVIWTTVKSLLHSFVSVAARCVSLEVPVAIVALGLFLAATVLRPLGFLMKHVFSLNENPFTKIARGIVTLHAKVAGFLREHIRYPLARGLTYCLSRCRDFFVRKVENAIQEPNSREDSVSQKNKHKRSSTFDALSALKISSVSCAVAQDVSFNKEGVRDDALPNISLTNERFAVTQRSNPMRPT